jgi:hypothetical protein
MGPRDRLGQRLVSTTAGRSVRRRGFGSRVAVAAEREIRAQNIGRRGDIVGSGAASERALGQSRDARWRRNRRSGVQAATATARSARDRPREGKKARTLSATTKA